MLKSDKAYIQGGAIMGAHGQANYRGVNTQAKAAILLFLINFYEADFDSITLEDSEWEDFTLSFQSGKKIVAEAKAWKNQLGLNNVIDILQGFVQKKDNLSSEDEILIVCNSIDPLVPQGIDYLRYNLSVAEIPGFKSYKKPEKLTPEIIELLKKTKFYKLPSNDIQSADDYLFNETVARLYRILPMWLPQHEVEKLMTYVLKEKIYDASERGDTLTKTEFIQYLEEYKKTKIAEAGAYDSEKQKVTKQVERMISATIDKDERWLLEGSNLISLSAQPMMMNIALDLISRRNNLQLYEWDVIWRALINRSYTYRVIGIMEDNVQSLDNAKYVLGFLTESVPELIGPSMERYSRDHALTIVTKIITAHPELSREALTFVESFLKARANAYKKTFSKRDLSYEKENVAKILTAIYGIDSDDNESKTKLKIIELLESHFNFIEDDGEYLNTAPIEAYQLLLRWLNEDFYERIERIKQLLVSDFNESKYYGRGFDGWELMGGMESGFSKHFTIYDRGFVKYILTPAFEQAYADNKDDFWAFLVTNVLTTSVRQVSAFKPDFMSRASIPIIIEEYLKGKNDKQAFRILKSFLKMNKGIPDRSRLMFQTFRELGNIEKDKRWKITKTYLDMSESKLPPSTFVEDVVIQLAITGNIEALDYVENWMNNPKYIDTTNRFHFYADTVIARLLDSSNEFARQKGIQFLKLYLKPSGKWEDGDNTRAWDISPLLVKTFFIDRDELARIILELYDKQKKLTKNRQLVITSILSDQEIKDSGDVQFLHSEIVQPIIIEKLGGDIENIVEKFTNHHAREQFLKFAEKLMETKKFKQGMDLVRIFLDDPNPNTKNEPDDPDGTFNYHQKIIDGNEEIVITTVRGWVPFVLRRTIRIEASEYLDEVIRINEKLLTDENYYVRFQALILLSDLARNRHTVVPPDRKERFISLESAMHIEDIAFKFLENEENRPYKPLMERVLYCFNFLRSLNEKNAKRLLLSAKNLSFAEDIDHLSSLYLFFAEFRKESFISKADIKYLGKDLYEELSNFDDSFFKEMLSDEVVNGGSEMRRHLAWQFWRLVGDNAKNKNSERENYEEMFEISYRYLDLMTKKYDHSAFEMLFHFVDDNLQRKTSECLELWIKAIKTENEFLKKNEASLVYHQDWWDRMNTAEIAVEIRNEKGDESFLECVEVLLSNPRKFQGIHNPRILLEELQSIDSGRASLLVDQFNEKYPHIYAQNRLNDESLL